MLAAGWSAVEPVSGVDSAPVSVTVLLAVWDGSTDPAAASGALAVFLLAAAADVLFADADCCPVAPCLLAAVARWLANIPSWPVGADGAPPGALVAGMSTETKEIVGMVY